MSKIQIDRMILALIAEVDYDIAKSYNPKLSEDPDEIEPRMERLRAIVARHMKVKP